MQPNPLRRPHSWSDILRSLDGETTADDVRLMFRSLEAKISGVSDAISLQGEELRARDEHVEMLLKGIKSSVDEIPSLTLALQNVTCPYFVPFRCGSDSNDGEWYRCRYWFFVRCPCVGTRYCECHRRCFTES